VSLIDSYALQSDPRCQAGYAVLGAGPAATFVALLFLATMLVAFVPSSRSLPALKQTWQLSQATFK
jgi:hypothetical protein